MPLAAGCNNTATASVTINALPVATIALCGSPYCAVGTATVAQTGTAGGTYSTRRAEHQRGHGEIDLVASTPGTYTVTYAFSSGRMQQHNDSECDDQRAACGDDQLCRSPYCAVGTASVTQTGTAGGTYSTAQG